MSVASPSLSSLSSPTGDQPSLAPGGVEATAAAGIATILLRLHDRLERLEEALDESWLAWLEGRGVDLRCGPLDGDGRLRNRLLSVLLIRTPVPAAARARWSDVALRIALVDRDDALRGLCLLALARRPGVLRCCIDREARAALRVAIGDVFERLASAAAGGRAVPSDVAAWSPMQWACVGYFDWLSMTAAEDRLHRRLLRSALPMRVGGIGLRRRRAPPERGAAAALSMLMEADSAWPC